MIRLIDALRLIANDRHTGAEEIARDALEESGIPVEPVDTDHVVMRDSRFICGHCQSTYAPNMPIPINLMVAISTQFTIDHAQCKPRT